MERRHQRQVRTLPFQLCQRSGCRQRRRRLQWHHPRRGRYEAESQPRETFLPTFLSLTFPPPPPVCPHRISSTDGHGVENAVTPSSPQPASGNGAIVQPKKIQGIGFGDIFKEGSVKSKVRIPHLETEDKKENVSLMTVATRVTFVKYRTSALC